MLNIKSANFVFVRETVVNGNLNSDKIFHVLKCVAFYINKYN